MQRADIQIIALFIDKKDRMRQLNVT